MTRRRILHLIDTGGPGGAETIFLNLVTELDAARWDSIAVVPEKDWLYGALCERGVQPLVLSTRGSFDLRYVRELHRLIKRERVSIVQAHLLTSAVYGSIAGRLTGIPVVCTFHGTADFPETERFKRAKVRAFDREANRVVFVSQSLRRSFESAMSLQRAREQVIENGIDAAQFRRRPDAGLRAELGVRPGEILIGAIGNVRASKAYDVLLRAAAVLKRTGTRFRVVIVGDTRTPLLDGLLALRGDLGLEEEVRFVGFRADIPRVLGALDVFVLSSSAEGFSLSTIQALAAGIPVVATRCGGPEDILEDGVTGQLVESDRPGALAAAIQRAASDQVFVKRTTQAGQRVVEARFTRDEMVRRYQAIYEHCVGADMEPLARAPVEAGALR